MNINLLCCGSRRYIMHRPWQTTQCDELVRKLHSHLFLERIWRKLVTNYVTKIVMARFSPQGVMVGLKDITIMSIYIRRRNNKKEQAYYSTCIGPSVNYEAHKSLDYTWSGERYKKCTVQKHMVEFIWSPMIGIWLTDKTLLISICVVYIGKKCLRWKGRNRTWSRS